MMCSADGTFTPTCSRRASCRRGGIGSRMGKIASAVLDRFRKDARRQNLFTEPFFVICALRLKGGERIMPPPTMLMIPNSESAPVAGSTDFSADEMRMSVAAAVCRLQWRVRIPDTLRDFEEVTHVDILVSDEMPLSDRKSEWKSYHRLSFGGFTHSLSPDGGCGEKRITEDALVQCWRQEPMDEADMLAAILTAKDYRVIMEIPGGECAFGRGMGGCGVQLRRTVKSVGKDTLSSRLCPSVGSRGCRNDGYLRTCHTL